MCHSSRQPFRHHRSALLNWLLAVVLALSPFGYVLPSASAGCDHSESMSMHEMPAQDMVDMGVDTGQDRGCCCDDMCNDNACGATGCGLVHVAATIPATMPLAADCCRTHLIIGYSPLHIKVVPSSLFRPPRLQLV